jgi:Uma2 family endonuclease
LLNRGEAPSGYTSDSYTLEQVMATQPVESLSPEEYLKIERAAEFKSEYIDGFLVAMPGARRPHILITVNITSSLHSQLRSRPCEVYTQDMRVRIAEGHLYAYPDVTVVCGQPEFEDKEFDVLLNPTVIIEVLSESTEGYDRGLKFERYRRRASLQEYVLVSQDRIVVERFSRQGEHWLLTDATSFDEAIELSSIGCTLALRDIYEKVEGLRTIEDDDLQPV